MSIAAFFHDYGLTNECFSRKCAPLHQKMRVNRTNDVKTKILACLPILGQIIGGITLYFGVAGLLTPQKENKFVCASLIVRGLLTILGLGILCLLIDIIVTIATIIKRKCATSQPRQTVWIVTHKK